MHQVGN